MWDMSVNDFGLGWFLAMSFGMVAFWALVIWGVLAFARGWRSSHPEPAGLPPEQPLDILQRRLARGEIAAEEFERDRDVLLHEPRGTPA